MGALEVAAAAARVGSRGLRLQAGTACVADDFVSIVPPPPTVQGVQEACRELSIAGVEVVDPGATLRAGERVALGEGLVVGSDLSVEIAPELSPFASVRDDSPADETGYVAEFDLRLDSLVLGGADRLELLVARSAAGEVTFRLVLQSDGGGAHEAFLEARLDSGAFVSTPAGSEAAIAAGWHRLRLEWAANAGSGLLSLKLDGAGAGSLTGLANGGQRVDHVDLGAVSGDLSGAAGTLDLDQFGSWR